MKSHNELALIIQRNMYTYHLSYTVIQSYDTICTTVGKEQDATFWYIDSHETMFELWSR